MKRKITLLDGAMGTNLLKMGMPSGVCVEMWILEHAKEITALQKEYIEAGSKIIYAPTFGANPITLGKYGISDCAEINKKLVEISKAAVDGKDVLIAGDISSTGLMPSPYGEATYDDYFNAFREQASALENADVDLFVIETSSLLFEAMAAVDAVRSVSDKKIFVTFTIGKTGKTFVGDDIRSCIVTAQEKGVSAFGINCSEGEESVYDAILKIAPIAKIPIIAKSNAGLPDQSGNNGGFSSDPDTFASWGKKLIQAGASYIGGCCGTTPAHIKALDKMLVDIGYEADAVKPTDDTQYLCSANTLFPMPCVSELPERICCDEELVFNLPSADEALFCRIFIEDEEKAANLSEACIACELPIMIGGNYECIVAGIKHLVGRCIIDPESDITDDEKNKLKTLYGCIVPSVE